MAKNEAAALAERLRVAAGSVGAHLVEGHVRTGSASTVPEVYLHADAAIALLSAAKPRVIYIDETVLEFEDLLWEARELLHLDADDETPAALRAATAQLRKHDAEHCSTSAHFVVDSILHTTAASASWWEEFESQLDELATTAREVAEGDRERARAVESAHVEALARRLLAEPAFNFGKTSAAKRHLLATTMFPDEDGRMLDEVVDLAQRLDWLEQ